MLEGEFVVFLAFGSRCRARVSLLVGRSVNAIVNLVFADDGGRLVVADVAVKSFEGGRSLCTQLCWREMVGTVP